MIVDTVTSAGQFSDKFNAMGRGKQFSYEALEVLFEYYEELSDSLGEPFELDVIGICCDWAEYDSIEDAYETYSEDVCNETDVRITTGGTVLVQAF